MINIEFDSSKCSDPRDCRKCMDACPEGVFMTYPQDMRAPGKAAGNWAIMPSFIKLCTGCRICEDVCPAKALSVVVAETIV
ncbi:4Fe-4S dicluster domain-containing protein [Chloroflexota bacterium]